MTAPPCRTCFSARASDGLRSSRFGPTCPVVPASFSVWQLPQLAAKIALPFGAALVDVPPPELEVVGAAGFDAVTPHCGTAAHLAMYAATSFASWPLTRF